jgi:hypothetical protein
MKKIYVILLAMFLVLAVAGCSAPEKISQEQCWAYNPYDQTEEYLGLINNLFVAEVVKKEETFINGIDTPCQKIRVKVIENIKGKLAADKEVVVIVEGGVTADGKYEYDYGFDDWKEGSLYLMTGGILSEKDVEVEKGIVNAWPPETAGCLISRVAINLPKDYKDSEAYEKWVKAYENEVPFKGFGDE